MVDCNITANYFAEKRRMTKRCKLGCSNCPLSRMNNNKGQSCTAFEMLYPEKAIAVVQKWSNARLQKTYLTEFLEKYPKALLNDDGTPQGICPYQLGLKDSIADCKIGDDCVACWNQTIEDGE